MPQEEVIQQLLQFTADHEWINQHRQELLQQYAEQWIAVKNGRVIAGAPELDDLLRALGDPAHTCVEFITREPLEMVL